MGEDKIKRAIPFSYQVVIIVGFIVVFYQLYSLSTSIYNESTVDQYNREQRQEISKLYDDLQLKKKQYILTSLNSFFEKGGKEINKLNPGEKEIIIHEHDTERLFVENNAAEEMLEETSPQQVDPYVASLPVSRQWLYFFFQVK